MAEWAIFQGGELEGERPDARCASCRTGHPAGTRRRDALCFHCYRLEFDRRRRASAAAELQSMSAERLQYLLPFEAVDKQRLRMLREDIHTRLVGDLVVRRRRAQIAARRSLGVIGQRLAVGRANGTDGRSVPPLGEANDSVQFPASWIPFLMGPMGLRGPMDKVVRQPRG